MMMGAKAPNCSLTPLWAEAGLRLDYALTMTPKKHKRQLKVALGRHQSSSFIYNGDEQTNFEGKRGRAEQRKSSHIAYIYFDPL